MKAFWDDRYSETSWAYGEDPNVFVKEKLPLFKPGTILFPAEGEGRNAVYAAKLGWNVSAFDYSVSGKEKALKWAEFNRVNIDYQTRAFLEEEYPKDSFDAICNVFVHFEPELKTKMHKRLDRYLKSGGIFIIEAYSKEHREINKLNPAVGGPPSAEPMYSIEEIKNDFGYYEILHLDIERVHLKEGLYHVGESSVLRFIGRKP